MSRQVCDVVVLVLDLHPGVELEVAVGRLLAQLQPLLPAARNLLLGLCVNVQWIWIELKMKNCGEIFELIQPI